MALTPTEGLWEFAENITDTENGITVTTTFDSLILQHYNNITSISNDHTNGWFSATSGPNDSCSDAYGSNNNSCHDNHLIATSFFKRNQIFLMSFYITVQLVGFSLNATVSRFITKTRMFRDSASLVLFNLSFVDCLHCLILTFPIVAIATGSWARDDHTCAVYGFLFHCLASVSLNAIAAIAIERFENY